MILKDISTENELLRGNGNGKSIENLSFKIENSFVGRDRKEEGMNCSEKSDGKL
jgi:hypothetical protein